jgi:hypothetical protein
MRPGHQKSLSQEQRPQHHWNWISLCLPRGNQHPLAFIQRWTVWASSFHFHLALLYGVRGPRRKHNKRSSEDADLQGWRYSEGQPCRLADLPACQLKSRIVRVARKMAATVYKPWVPRIGSLRCRFDHWLHFHQGQGIQHLQTLM